MTATQKQILISAGLYEMRITARSLLGDRYTQRMNDLGSMLSRMAARDNKSVLQAAIDESKRCEDKPMHVIFVLAAAVELLEPSA